MLVKKITSYPFHFLTKMKFRPYLFPKYSGFGKEFQQKKESPRVGIRMGFLIAKHILYSGKTMDQTNDVTVHGHSMPAHCNRILPMLRIPNRQNPRPQRYHTEFSVQKIPTHEK